MKQGDKNKKKLAKMLYTQDIISQCYTHQRLIAERMKKGINSAVVSSINVMDIMYEKLIKKNEQD